jgi:hypothetical protein
MPLQSNAAVNSAAASLLIIHSGSSSYAHD